MNGSRRQEPRKRIPGFDHLRVVCTFAVVLIHSTDRATPAQVWGDYCVFAVPCFLLMSGFLTMGSLMRKQRTPLARLLGHRAQRLVPAYLAWTLVYVVARWVKHRYLSHETLDLTWVNVLLFGGASYQLWFVPSLLLLTALFLPMGIHIQGWRSRHRTGIFLLALALAGAAVGGRALASSVPFPQVTGMVLSGTLGLGAFFGLGMLAGVVHDRAELLNWPLGRHLVVPAAVLTVCAGLLLRPAGPACLGARILMLSAGLFTLSLCATLPTSEFVAQRVAPVMFGVFLAHGLFVEGIQVALVSVGVDTGSVVSALSVTTVSFVLSALLCMGLAELRLTRWLVS